MTLDTNQVEKPIRKMRKLLKKVSANPTPKQIHSLRTNSRRLETILQATDPDKNDRKVLKLVSRLRRRAGKVRDMDVLTAYVMELPHQAAEEDCSVRLLEHLGAVRKTKAKQLHKEAQRDSSPIRKRLKRSAKNATQLDLSTKSQITSSALEVLSELQRPAHLNKANLHPYRLKVKELQNLLRLAANNEDKTFVESLGRVKDAIGEWHDWVELQSIASGILDHPQCKLLQELKDRTQERFTQALRLTDEMRKKHLGLSDRKPGTKSKPPSAAQSVWTATAALSA